MDKQGRYRRLAREIAFRTLFAYDFRKDEDIFNLLEEQIQDIRIKLSNYTLEYAYKLINVIYDNLDTIDEEIQEHLINWKLERLGYPERAFLRLGVGELIFLNIKDKGRVFIDIIDLAYCYLNSIDAIRFINGVLSSVFKDNYKNGNGDEKSDIPQEINIILNKLKKR